MREYSWLIEEIRQNKKNGNEIETAVDMALDSMPEDFVIRQFLLDNRAEVKDVFLTEYNEQKTMAAFKDEGFEEGKAEGRAEGKVEGKLEPLIGLVKKGILTLAQAADEAHMTEEASQSKLLTCNPHSLSCVERTANQQ